ncbi:MAG: NAD-glutamate dehydrogenase GdhB [Candidatus Pelagadaptatus aseana]|uniref:NAD-glutamate dehydrogenase n=1 Tax=Candidatus Pelagadaptatus aseana TaxID=3120508 RepID=UPI0039B351EC
MDISMVASESKESLLRQLGECIDEKLEKKEAQQLKTFSSIYFDKYPLSELEGRAINDVFGSLYFWWNYVQSRPDDCAKVRVFNPNLEEDGWLCGHTVIVVAQKDMPFLVDSIRIEIKRRNIEIHAVKSTLVTAARDAKGELLDLLPRDGDYKNTKNKKHHQEAMVYFEINLHTDESAMSELAKGIEQVLRYVNAAVEDYKPMIKACGEVAKGLKQAGESVLPAAVKESQQFLKWMEKGHYTFLGYSEYEFLEQGGEKLLREVPDKRLGIFRESNTTTEPVAVDDFNPGMSRFYLSPQVLSFTKSSMRSRVHRYAYSDYVVVKRFDGNGKVIGESRFLGLYTSPVYSLSPSLIPVMREKVSRVMERSGLHNDSHDGKALRRVLETFPRDELLQSSESELFETALDVANIQERHMVRLYMRRDPYGKFVNCTLYVPRDDFNTQTREKIQALIGEAVHSEELEFTTYFSESVLARCHIVFKLQAGAELDYDVKRLESQVIDITRSWEDRLRDSLCDSHGEESGARLFEQYQNAFSSGYQENFEARAAVHDIDSICELDDSDTLAMSFYQPIGAETNMVRFKVFRLSEQLELSDIIPLLENLGLRVIGEHPYRIRSADGDDVWMHDFDLKYANSESIDFHQARGHFQDAFESIWRGSAESDSFNHLVLGARLEWREVSVLRAYACYMKQTNFPFSKTYIAATLTNHLEITRNLVALFKSCFDPRLNHGTEKDLERIARLESKIIQSLDDVSNLNEDRIIRRYLDVIRGTLRTNFFQMDKDGEHKDYISFKFSTRDIPDVPEPRPMFEIFVFSPCIEGVHLRGGQVARGGLRWSDRLQDYRTEVLGLVKAQQVKNAVIVPNGAKGGFVVKRPPKEGGREAFMKEGVRCYQIFIRGLLDVTDNIIEGEIVPPQNVVRRDPDDPYLVVAADKGTATFSDIANEISLEYNHWLGDAFASGGSQGYDHKGMGITARGAWVSVQRHFKEKGLDVQKQDFTVIGIGDMAGDVFGNGMLMSEHIQLTAAFNHLHIFIDPNPDAAKSFKERQRMFNTPGVTWADYNDKLISAGGGVFSRAAKAIPISKQMQQRFDIKEDRLTPTELIHSLLQAPVDLIWNGGIGTYVKAKTESHADVGDKANDTLRVNGEDLRCRVFGEGGNLGLTQLGRIEFCLNGGACNSDFIDNAAGVDCSDHEVNIKILLDGIIASGDMTSKQRNKLLADMTDTVAELVLDNNYKQTQAISLAESQVQSRAGEYRRFMNYMEETGHLDRELEFLPSDDDLLERLQAGQSLTRPELSVLISYAKVMLKEALADEELTNDEYVARSVEEVFPPVLRKKYSPQIFDHRLRKEIVATQVANDMVNHMGINFAHRLTESTGSGLIDLAKAYVAARDIYAMHDVFESIESLDYQVDSALQHDIQSRFMHRMRRATRWLLRNRRGHLSPKIEVTTYAKAVQNVVAKMPDVMCGAPQQEWQEKCQELMDKGIPKKLAAETALPRILYSGLSIVDAAKTIDADPLVVARVYFLLADKLGLHWFAKQIADVTVESFWQAMAREAFMDDVESQMKTLAVSILRLSGGNENLEQVIEMWIEQHQLLVDRWRAMITELQAAPGTDYAMFSVALRELLDLAQASQHCQTLEDGSIACSINP